MVHGTTLRHIGLPMVGINQLSHIVNPPYGGFFLGKNWSTIMNDNIKKRLQALKDREVRQYQNDMANDEKEMFGVKI